MKLEMGRVFLTLCFRAKSFVNKVKDGQIVMVSVRNTYIYILTRKKESDNYLATVSRHRWSRQIAMKVDKMCSFQPALWPSSAKEEDSTP